MKGKFIKNSIWLTAEKVVKVFIGVVNVFWIARLLGPLEYGVLSFAQSMQSVFLVFTLLGTDKVAIKLFAENDYNESEIVSGCCWLRIIGSVISFTIMTVFVFSYTQPGSQERKALIIYSLVFFSYFFIFFESYFKGVAASACVAKSRIISVLMFVGAAIYGTVSEYSTIYFAWVFVLEFYAYGILLTIYYLKHRNERIQKYIPEFGFIRKIVSISWPMALSSVFVILYMKIDQIMINYYSGNVELGIYSVAVRLSEAWYFIPVIIASSTLPYMINLKRNNQNYNEICVLSFEVCNLITITGIVLVTFFSRYIIELFLGESYLLSVPILTIHIISGLFVFLGVARGSWILTESLQKYSMLYISIGLVVNVLLNYFLIPVYGGRGAAIATLLAQCVVVIVAPALFKKTRPCAFMILESFLFRNSYGYLKKSLKSFK